MASVFSLYVAILSSSVSSAPACSPAATRLTNRSSKCSGCFASASASAVPPSTSPLIARMSFCIAGFSWPAPMMSNDCTSGMPAVIIVAICREKIAMSAAVTRPCLRNSMLCFLTRVGTTPWRRSSARTAVSLAATTLPLTFLPVRSVPSQVKGTCPPVVAVVAMRQDLQRRTSASRNEPYGRRRPQSIVTLLISSRLVMPSLTFFSPDMRRSATPSFLASAAICIALPPSMMIRPICSVTVIT